MTTHSSLLLNFTRAWRPQAEAPPPRRLFSLLSFLRSTKPSSRSPLPPCQSPHHDCYPCCNASLLVPARAAPTSPSPRRSSSPAATPTPPWSPAMASPPTSGGWSILMISRLRSQRHLPRSHPRHHGFPQVFVCFKSIVVLRISLFSEESTLSEKNGPKAESTEGNGSDNKVQGDLQMDSNSSIKEDKNDIQKSDGTMKIKKITKDYYQNARG